VEVFILFLSGFNGLLASMVLPWFGLESYINCVAGKTCYYSTKYLLGITVQIDGLENYNHEEPCVLVTNHQTLVDIAIFGAFCGKGCVTVPKKTLKKIPIFGWYCKVHLYIHRSDVLKLFN
jgi:1-acyl-sn-glycerol-3-phosphate acyltransferase